MAHDPIDRPRAAGFSFATVACEVAHATGGAAGCRLSGRDAEGRRLLLDFAGGRVTPPPPQRLDAASVTVDAADPSRWRLDGTQGRFVIDGARLFVHEDLAERAAAVIPPRPVPPARRLFWRVVFLLLATPFGRRWLERRAATP